MNLGMGFDDDGLIDELQQQDTLLERNAKLACVDAAMEAREFLRNATVGPKSGAVAKVAELWRVEETQDGADTFNPSEIAAYIEYGVGIFNEGPGSKEEIVPRRAKVLSWIDPQTGKRRYAKRVKGYKGTAMLRTNMDHLMGIGVRNLEEAAQATLEGRSYA